MEDQKEKGQSQSQQDPPNSPSSQVPTERGSGEPVRSRWTPKPEQILILESIFNSGMVNPPKDETVRIRKVLEKFGTVGDANVFYWFQNRRSRSRRRQRQMQATAQVSGGANPCHHHQYHYHTNNNNNSSAAAVAAAAAMGFSGSSFTINSSSPSPSSSSISYNLSGSSSLSCGVGGGVQEGFGGFSPSTQRNNFPEIDHTSAASSALYPSDHAPNFNYHSGFGGSNVSGFITVFINGVATEIPRGPMDIKTVFGEDVMLVHSSGVSVPTNEFGFLMQSLQHGESYFLVSKQTQA